MRVGKPASTTAGAGSVAGQWRHPVLQIQLYSAEDWELFIEEWLHSLKADYATVERHGGSGDMGRDVLGFVTAAASPWDNYQCKHYDHPLAPSDIWGELGKLLYHTHVGDYTPPRMYYFVAPQGVGTKLANLLRRPDVLRQGLLTEWGAHCRTKIASDPIELTPSLRAHIDASNFDIFRPLNPLTVIDQHAKTRYHVDRFGLDLPPRPRPPAPPAEVASSEGAYIRQLLDAYADHLKMPVPTVTDLAARAELNDHLHDCRVDFFSAEALRTFSRDTLPDDNAFTGLLEEVRVGVSDEARKSHVDGYARVLSVTQAARILPLTGSALVSCVSMRDRGGMCHQLANINRLRWVKV